MKVTGITIVPYTRTSKRTIKINGYSITNAINNICEPGWDICFHITARHQGGAIHTYLFIKDNLYTYTWQSKYSHNQKQPTIHICEHHDKQIIQDFRKFI